MFLFLGVFLVTIIVYILRFHYEIVHAFYLSLKIDGPPALPIIGNGLLFLNNSSAGIKSNQTNELSKIEANFCSLLLTQKISISSLI